MLPRVFRRIYTRTDRDGSKIIQQTKKWYITYRDHAGDLQTIPGFVDRLATEARAQHLQSTADRIRAGLLPVTAARDPLTLTVLASRYRDSLAKTTKNHGDLVQTRLRQAIEALSWDRPEAIDREAFLGYLERRRAGGISAQTLNHNIQTWHCFCLWLVREKWLSADPLASVPRYDVAGDRRRRRRALSHEEFWRFIDAASQGGSRNLEQPGIDRAMLYLLAAWTGFRAAELHSLTPESFEADGESMVVTVEAAYAKNRREDTLPLPRWLSDLYTEWLQGRSGLLWPKLKSSRGNAVNAVRADLKRAGIPFADSRGRVFDFHSLRGQFATMMARAGVSLTEAQRLMRHSTPILTSNVYTHLEREELLKAVERLSGPPEPLADHSPEGSPKS